MRGGSSLSKRTSDHALQNGSSPLPLQSLLQHKGMCGDLGRSVAASRKPALIKRSSYGNLKYFDLRRERDGGGPFYSSPSRPLWPFAGPSYTHIHTHNLSLCARSALHPQVRRRAITRGGRPCLIPNPRSISNQQHYIGNYQNLQEKKANFHRLSVHGIPLIDSLCE